MKFNPLDIVLTPGNALAVVKEVDPWGGVQIEFLKGMPITGEKVAWWNERDGLKLIDSIPRLLTRCMVHPSGNSARNPKYDVEHFPSARDPGDEQP